MSELFWFLLGGVYAWIIRDIVGSYIASQSTIVIDWQSIKKGIPKDGAIVVAGPHVSVDWSLISRALESEGYSVIRKELH